MSLFAETLRLRREELGLTQAHVARSLEVGQQTLSEWERGRSIPKVARVKKLAGVLSIDEEQLFRLAGYLPERDRSQEWTTFHELYTRMHELTDEELWLLTDRAWEELRERRGLTAADPTAQDAEDGRSSG